MQGEMAHKRGIRGAADRLLGFCDRKKLQESFFYAVAALLFFTGLLKLIGLFGRAGILNDVDPLLGFRNRWVLVLLVVLELSLSAYLAFGQSKWLRSMLTAWLATNFLVYRIGLWSLGAGNVCNCLGYLNHISAIPPLLLTRIELGMLGFMVAGS